MSAAPQGFDVSVPSPARVYDACLGGKDNFAIDREAVLTAVETAPELIALADENRAYLRRAVAWIAEHTSIEQFLDIGSGLPTVDNTHQIAQRVTPAARVVYVDQDPMVLAHGRAILADNPNTTVVTGDMCDPGSYLEDSGAQRLLDFSEPVCVMLVSLLHCIPDEADPFGALSTIVEMLPSGSCLAYSHIVSDNAEDARVVTEKVLSTQMPWGRVRLLEEAARAMDGLDIVAPDLDGAGAPRFVECSTWKNPDKPTPMAKPTDTTRLVWEYAAVGIKP